MRRDGSSTDANYNQHYGVFLIQIPVILTTFFVCNLKAFSYKCTADAATLYITVTEGIRCSMFVYETDIKHEACLGSLETDW